MYTCCIEMMFKQHVLARCSRNATTRKSDQRVFQAILMPLCHQMQHTTRLFDWLSGVPNASMRSIAAHDEVARLEFGRSSYLCAIKCKIPQRCSSSPTGEHNAVVGSCAERRSYPKKDVHRGFCLNTSPLCGQISIHQEIVHRVHRVNIMPICG